MSTQPAPPSREDRVNEILAAYLEAAEAGNPPDPKQVLAAHPELADEVNAFFTARDQFRAAAGAPPPPTLGTVRYFGDYELLEEIARGGMGVVYKARQVSLDRVVALKMILSGQFASADDVERFYREARTAASLRHPNIVAIHEVGEYQGQHYFSMDLIGGPSLASVVRERPLPPRKAADCVRLVAQAVQFAHDRGVLHRDLKPSNILLEVREPTEHTESGRDEIAAPWVPLVTDFGLAKKVDEPGLTATGAIVGTPGYMPPEQASGAALSPTSDVYSLGAVLYELVTGRPPFQAANTLDVLRQVLEVEPVPPRRLNPAISRDLETVLLKCLVKDPPRRYQSAAALADDLQAYLDDEPIKARRPGMVERAGRWAWRQRSRLTLAAVVGLVSAIAALAGWHGWASYADSQLGRVTFKGDPGLTAEILDATETRTVVPRFALPREEPVALPEGEYRVRYSGSERVSETGSLRVLRGDRQEFALSLRPRWQPGRLWSESLALVDLGGRFAVAGRDPYRARLRCTTIFGSWDEPSWEVTVDPPKDQYTAAMREVLFGRQVRLLPPADLDGDGTRDLLWTGWTNGSALGVVAVSGKSGAPLWHAEPTALLPAGAAPGAYRYYSGWQSEVVGATFADVDGDGRPDAVLTVHCTGGRAHPEVESGKAVETGTQRWVEALSGQTGRTLWRHALDPRWFANDQDKPGIAFAFGGDRQLLGCVAGTRLEVVDPRDGRPAWPVHDLGDRPTVRPRVVGSLLLCEAGERLSGFRLADGEPAWPSRDLGFRPARQAQPLGGGTLLLVQANEESVKLASYDPMNGTVGWSRDQQARYGRRLSDNPLRDLLPEDMRDQPGGPTPSPWPAVADLDGDGRAEVIVPFVEADAPWAGLEVLDGTTGDMRWQRRWKADVAASLRQPERFVVGPDLDGDSRPELFVASFGMRQMRQTRDRGEYWNRLFVHALSGKDGRVLWAWERDVPQDSDSSVGALQWWQPGADGRAQLVVPLSQPGQKATATVFVLTASTGRLAHVIPDLREPRVADLDGDGIPDLYQVRSVNVSSFDGPRTSEEVTVVRGEPGEVWRRPGTWHLAGDLDGDGTADLSGVSGRQTLAVSGLDGGVLWQTPEVLDKLTAPWPHADLDGDGVPDLIGESYTDGGTHQRPRLDPWKRHAVSGKTGRKLWPPQARTGKDRDPLQGSAEGTFSTGKIPDPECHDLRGDGRGVVLYAYGLNHLAGQANQPRELRDLGDAIADRLTAQTSELCLAAVAGEDGRLLWKQALARWPAKDGVWSAGGGLRFAVVPLGRGDKGLACLVESGDGTSELQARRADDGEVIWKRSIHLPKAQEDERKRPLLLAGDLDGDGIGEVFLVDRRSDKESAMWMITTWRADDGSDGWKWKLRATHTRNPFWTAAIVANLDGIGPALCLSLGEELGAATDGGVCGQATLVVLDGRGIVREEFVQPFRSKWSVGHLPGKLRAHDLDGDGRDELVWSLPPKAVNATRGGFNRRRLLWTEEIDFITSIDDTGPGRPPVVCRERTLFDGATGKRLGELPYGTRLVASPADLGAVRYVSTEGVCRLLAGSATSDSASRYAEEPADPRLLRPLPWSEGRAYDYLLVCAAAAALWLVVPLVLLVVAIRRRSWRWGLVLLAWVGIGVAAWVWNVIPGKPSLSLTVRNFDELFELIESMDPWYGVQRLGSFFPAVQHIAWPLAFPQEMRPLRIALGLPLVVFAVALGWSLGRQRWGRVGLLLLATAFLGLGLAGHELWVDAADKDPTESYIADRWYLLLLSAAYLAGLLLLLAGACWAAAKATVRGLRAVRRR